jgi:hypothetical protein
VTGDVSDIGFVRNGSGRLCATMLALVPGERLLIAFGKPCASMESLFASTI